MVGETVASGICRLAVSADYRLSHGEAAAFVNCGHAGGHHGARLGKLVLSEAEGCAFGAGRRSAGIAYRGATASLLDGKVYGENEMMEIACECPAALLPGLIAGLLEEYLFWRKVR